jgi:hypothetical protein
MKVKVELYLDDPMAGGCGCSSGVQARMELVKRVREEAGIWDKIKKTGNGEYSRFVLPRVPEAERPRYLKDAVEAGHSLPFVFVDARLVHSGSFPELGEFKRLVGGA